MTRKHAFIETGISQPLALNASDAPLLPTMINIRLSGLYSAYLDLQAGIDWNMLEDGPVELRATANWKPHKIIKLYSEYVRMAPGIQSLTRSIYELSRPTESNSSLPWVHYLRTGAQLSHSKTWKILYQTDILLPRPGDDSSARPVFSNHLIRTGYQSPCECWGVDLVAQMTNPDLSAGFGTSLLDNMTMRVNFTIGDYTLGSL